MKKILILLAGILFLLPGCSSIQKMSPEDQFKKSFSKHTYETFTETSIKGVYEVYNGKQIYYYLPEGDVILLGNIISKDGKNLTQESNAKRMTSKLAKLPLDKALKIGNGKTAVVEFIDPNCHYCRLSFNFFNTRNERCYAVCFLLSSVQDSEKKIRHILCAQDKAKDV